MKNACKFLVHALEVCVHSLAYDTKDRGARIILLFLCNMP